MTPAALSDLRGHDVSRETADRLAAFAALLAKWNARINLVSPATLREVWTRHIVDSLQVFDLAAVSEGHWADLGTGGGFPGLVVAIVAADEAPDLRVTLVESDQRKAAFLAAALRETGVRAAIRAERIEAADPLAADIVSARALAPLSRLLGHAVRHMSPAGKAFFPKGRSCDAELEEALASWRFRYQKHPSRTDSQAVILQIEDIARG
jgi:16S rRNA (guanine527-N7)-methyltransferase